MPLSEYELEVRQEMLTRAAGSYVSRSRAEEVEQIRELARRPVHAMLVRFGRAAAERLQAAQSAYKRLTGDDSRPVLMADDDVLALGQAASDARDLIKMGVSPFGHQSVKTYCTAFTQRTPTAHFNRGHN